jgi:hypothetical protein
MEEPGAQKPEQVAVVEIMVVGIEDDGAISREFGRRTHPTDSPKSAAQAAQHQAGNDSIDHRGASDRDRDSGQSTYSATDLDSTRYFLAVGECLV